MVDAYSFFITNPLMETLMKVNRILKAAAAAFFMVSANLASAQMFGPSMPSSNASQLACQTPHGTFPMMVPPGAPLIAGVPCNGFAGPGITVLLPNGQGGFPMPGGPQGGFPMPGGPQGGFPMPGGPQGGFPASPQGFAAGQVAGAFGVNREGQVAAECVGQYGVTYAAAGCVTSRLTVDELNKCFRDGIGGRGCFGDNNTLVNMIRGNLQAAQRESGAVDQAIRGTTGISPRDIREHGPLGGPNSDARRICDGFASVFGGRC